ncbi:MAG: HEAT repeat domain-containing protein [Chitinophagaceae bacterium]|nr:MAG: HEAT repeat domain-containing protein [Chitinophagaceae bacterium]
MPLISSGTGRTEHRMPPHRQCFNVGCKATNRKCRILEHQLERLKNEVFSADPKVGQWAADSIGRDAGMEGLDYLITLLDLDDTVVRDRAALALESTKNNKALIPLLKAIFKKENYNRNGTMVFALSSLDCSKNLIEIFKILLYETYESKIAAYSILLDQNFEIAENDLEQIVSMSEHYKAISGEFPALDKEHSQAMIENVINLFVERASNGTLKNKSKP